MEVRRIRPDEFEAYRDVRLRALRRAPYAFSSTFDEASTRSEAEWRQFTERLATSSEMAGFALDRGDGNFGGLVSVRIEEGGSNEGEVNQMWLDEDFRGGEWGAALLDACECFAADAGLARLTLWVAEGNERAVRLYERCGYSPTGQTEAFPRGGVEVQLDKALP